MPSGPLAVIDIGSNTIHLLVGRVDGAAVVPIRSERIAARLGEGLERNSRIGDLRFRIAEDTVALFALVAEDEGASMVVALATSAVRDASNGTALVDAIQRRSRIEVRILSGEQEARLGYRGAISGAYLAPDQPVLVIDLGGGSAQLVQARAGASPDRLVSLQIGSKRMTDRCCPDDPPTPAQLGAVRDSVLASLPDWTLPPGTQVIAVGGSARALRNLTSDRLSPERLLQLAAESSRQPSGRFAQERGFTPSRSRVLPAAAATLAAILARYGLRELKVTRTALREGAILALASGDPVAA